MATLLALPSPAHAVPFVVTDLNGGVTAEQLAQSLVACGDTISNVTYTGAPESARRFSGGSGIIGFDDGIVLGTGRVADLGTANTSSNFSYETGQPGDDQLSAPAGYPTHDATVLEFDVTPDSDAVFSNQVFASEEYDEYVGSQFNDVFASTVTQPDGAAPAHCAVVADGDPVSVDTINNGSADDGAGATTPTCSPATSTGALGAEPDGSTTTLQCQASVTAGQPNHLRLAIADASDTAFDSWEFIQLESLSTNPRCATTPSTTMPTPWSTPTTPTARGDAGGCPGPAGGGPARHHRLRRPPLRSRRPTDPPGAIAGASGGAASL